MTVPAVTPRLRLLPPPPVDPPYDDEHPVDPPVHGTLALAFPPCDTVPLRLVPPAAAPAPAAGTTLVDAGRWGRRLAQAVVEVLVGARAAAQLSRYATLDVLEQLERWTGRLAVHGARTTRPVVASVHVCEPRAGIAEVCAVVDTGPRRRALALRLEATGEHWRCTVLQLG